MFTTIKNLKQLSLFLSVDPGYLETFSPEGLYYTFERPKPGSTEKRLIETPTGELRPLLDRIANELQETYRYRKTDAAYGFIRCGRYDTDKRNIVTNAQKHLGKKYLLNIDLDNFFYQVDDSRIDAIFSDYTLFTFDEPCTQALTRLVSYRGRLPMGSPTSPPLSNFATMAMDEDLLAWARKSSFVYSRYVDDLSFSSNMKISETHYGQINEILMSHRFAPDPEKIKWYGRNDVKEITGLLLDGKIKVPEVFLKEFDADLEKFREVWIMAHQYPDANVLKWLEKLEQVVNGRLAILAGVYSRCHPVYARFAKKFNEIKQVDEAQLSCNWRYAGYEI